MVSNGPPSLSSAANIRAHWSSKRRASVPTRAGSNGDLASSPEMMEAAGGAIFPETTRCDATQTPWPDCVVPGDRPQLFHSPEYVRRRSKPVCGTGPLVERSQSEMDDERAAAMLEALLYEGPASAPGSSDSGRTRFGFSYGIGGDGGVSKEGDRGREEDRKEEDAAVAAAVAAALAWSPTQAMTARTWAEYSQGLKFDERDNSDDDEERTRSDSGSSDGSRAEELTADDEARPHAGGDGANVVTADENLATISGHVINNASSVAFPDETAENFRDARRRLDENDGVVSTCTSACGSNSSADGGKAWKGEDYLEQEPTKSSLTSSPYTVDSSASASTEWVEKYSMGTMTCAGVRSVAAKPSDASEAPLLPANRDKRDSSRREKRGEPAIAGGGDSRDDILQAIGAAAAARHSHETGSRSDSGRDIVPGILERHQAVTSTQESRCSSDDKRAVSVAGRLEEIERVMGMGVVGIPRRNRLGPGRSVGSVEQKEVRADPESRHGIQRCLISETGLLDIEVDDDYGDVEGTAPGYCKGGSSFNNSSDDNDATSSELSYVSGDHRHRGTADGNSSGISRDDRSVVVRVGAIRSSDGIGASDVEEGGAIPNVAAIPYGRLNGIGKHWPPGVNPVRREEWLSPGEFSTVFGMSYPAFRRLPSWKRVILKQEVGLF